MSKNLDQNSQLARLFLEEGDVELKSAMLDNQLQMLSRSAEAVIGKAERELIALKKRIPQADRTFARADDDAAADSAFLALAQLEQEVATKEAAVARLKATRDRVMGA